MLKLTLRFESSWTNSFYEQDESGAPVTPRFDSGRSLNSSTRNLVRVDDEPFDPQGKLTGSTRIPMLRQLQAANPSLAYRVPDSFDSTVIGVLARLVGDVRRLRMIESDDPGHIALRAFAKGKYAVHIETETSMLTTLATAEPKDIQTAGAGICTYDALFTPSALTRELFGHLDMSVEDMELAVAHDPSALTAGSWAPDSTGALVRRLQARQEEQDAIVAAARKAAVDGDLTYVTPFPAMGAWMMQALPEDVAAKLAKLTESAAEMAAEMAAEADRAAIEGRVGKVKKLTPPPLTVPAGALDAWGFAGAVVMARLKSLPETVRQQMVDDGTLTAAGNLAGLAMSGNVGRLTEKDMFRFASGVPATSHSLPFSVELPMRVNGRDVTIPSGVLKKDGTLSFELDGDAALESELFDAITAASVGPLHFGKKGVAYITKLSR